MKQNAQYAMFGDAPRAVISRLDSLAEIGRIGA